MPDLQPNKDRFNTLLDSFNVFVLLGIVEFGVIFGLVLIHNPRSLIFLGSLVPDEYYSYYTFGLVTILYSLNYMIRIDLCLLTCLYFIITYLYCVTIFLTRELRLGAMQYRTIEKLRKPEDLRIVYRSFQVLNENVSCFMGQFFYILHGACIVYPVFDIALLIHCWNTLSPLTKGVLFFGIPSTVGLWTFFLQMCKYLFIRGNKILVSWKHNNWKDKHEKRLMKRFIKSCRLILLKHENYIVFGRMTQFIYIQSIMRWTFKVLLMLESS